MRDDSPGDDVHEARLRELLEAVAIGEISPSAAAVVLAKLPFEDLGDLRIDHHRELRTGQPEVVFGEGKTPDQCARAAVSLLHGSDGPVLVTRATPAQAEEVAREVPQATYDDIGRVVVARRAAGTARVRGTVAIVCAGTSDLPVATECATILDAFGVDADLLPDVGVAGVHRLFAVREALDAADVVVAVAGMEGALPTLVAGLVSTPVIAVPTSVGYGASFRGLAALLGMLTSCAPGVAVVNVDSGYGAAMVAVRTLRFARGARP